ncbi:MAG: CRISPR-associated endonuclease Cas3'', partial [Anaerolineae bacterium]|nr:CRISPR-associated endonuclease Cas3'' [Anaerolineae bacterium]
LLDNRSLPRDDAYLGILETLTRAWALGRKVQVEHQMPDGQRFHYLFSPYYVEPYASGRTHHVIGFRQPPEAIRTFKVERLRAVTLTEHSYEIPDDFDPGSHLANAWGIWTSEDEPVEVVVRFSARVAQRVIETVWHSSQQTEFQEDGSLLWRARVAETQEMLPWIRGWGADAEVLEPDQLRKRVADEVRRMMVTYDVGKPVDVPAYMRLWGKIEKKTGQMHPLIGHMLDVAAVAKVMWERVLAGGMRAHLAEMLELGEDATGQLVAFWVGLHDLGKACPGFQRKNEEAKQSFLDRGYRIKTVYGRQSFKHGIATALLLPDWLTENQHLSRRWAKQLASVLGGHHGTWPVPLELQTMELQIDELGEGLWEETREALLTAYGNVFFPIPVGALPENTEMLNGLLAVFSGLVSIADWIGSMMTYFPYQSIINDLNGYYNKAQEQAVLALKELNWLDWEPSAGPLAFTDLFTVPSPRPMQAQVIDLAEKLKEPALVIIEAPTGVGKTEAALYLADHWARTQQQRGMYVAMPTMATSNQMYSRVLDMVSRRYPEQQDHVMLIHSQSRWMDNQPTPELTS